MGLLDQPTRILTLGGRALGAGVSAALNELRGGGEQQQQQDGQETPGRDPQAQGTNGDAPTQRQRDQQAAQEAKGRQTSAKPKDFDDVTIARKVESQIFRGRGRTTLKQHIDVNAVDGVVYLRGVAKTPDLINTLEAETRAIPEVKGVENLLHLPHTPAPTRTDTPASARRTRSSSKKPAKPRTEPRSLNADKSSSEQGDAPEVLARTRKGRQPAPLGSHGEGSDESSAPKPGDTTDRFTRPGEDPVAGKRPGTEQPATTTVGTEGGPAGGGGEVVH